MPLLATLLGNAFVSVVAFFSSFVTKKIAVGAALGAFLVSGWVAVQVAVYGLWTAFAFALPTSPAFQKGMALTAALMPPHMFGALTLLGVVRIAMWVWDEQKAYAKAVSFIT